MRQKRQHKMMQFIVSLVLMALFLPAAPAQATQVQVNPAIRVGLYFGSNALPGANLLNQVGSGYRAQATGSAILTADSSLRSWDIPARPPFPW